jgi:4'-phosphopantetheinyl transferase
VHPAAALTANEVHLWIASLAPTPAAYDVSAAAVTADEREQASRFRWDTHRRRYVTGRGRLRRLLAGYLGIEPLAVPLTTNAHGKPMLDDPSLPVRFNLAHSEDIAVYAVTRDRDVGVDVERIDPTVDVDGLARRTLSATEHAAIEQLAGDDRTDAFFRLWTRKEAVLKATGVGLSAGPRNVDVSVGSFVVLPATDELAQSQWQVRDFAAVPGYAAAVAVYVDDAGVALGVPDHATWLDDGAPPQTGAKAAPARQA